LKSEKEEIKKEETLFEGKCAHQEASWISKTFFNWVTPLIHFTNR
jgi:hypothetical protein